MAVRNKRRCRNCPTGTPIEKPKDQVVLQITESTEATRLWSATCLALNAHVGILEQYVLLQMKGMPVSSIQALVKRLQAVVQTNEVSNDNQSAENHQSVSESDRVNSDVEDTNADGQLPSEVRPSDSRGNRRRRGNGGNSVLQWQGKSDRGRDYSSEGQSQASED